MKKKENYNYIISFFVFILITLVSNSTILAESTSFDSSSMLNKEIAVLRSLDKLYARTSTFEVPVGQTVKFGKSLFIRPQTCKKSPPTKRPESATFLQIWEQPIQEITEKNDKEENYNENNEQSKKTESKWIFSGWMFASSPALSAMDHPVFDVWLIDCKNSKTKSKGKSKETPSTDKKSAE